MGGTGEAGNGVSMMKHLILGLVFMSGILAACGTPSTQSGPDPSGPDSKAVLCQALGKDPSTEPLCNYANDGELRDLLVSVFPLDVATQADVHDKLSVYLLSAKSTDIRIFEYYAIEQTLFEGTPVKAIFTFDNHGVLRQVDIVDILSRRYSSPTFH